MSGGGKSSNTSGGGGGGGSKKPKKPVDPMPSVVVQPFAPGMDTLIAQQLARGFGGTPEAILAELGQFYQPMTIPSYPPPGGGVGGGSNSAPSNPQQSNSGSFMTDFGILPNAFKRN